ncbi:MAG: hypothetical protein ETSY1_43200 [Candidatus Entotheonella factor]|uniref:Uncharacterized protein n=1 Tax=Entotheonella factor TaxID=1429438 RepID=W4L3Q9_ENTF1|nr:MAG: hypothetical protein ETSY1_43200 [Candidatus Entotheonella factor]
MDYDHKLLILLLSRESWNFGVKQRLKGYDMMQLGMFLFETTK